MRRTPKLSAPSLGSIAGAGCGGLPAGEVISLAYLQDAVVFRGFGGDLRRRVRAAVRYRGVITVDSDLTMLSAVVGELGLVRERERERTSSKVVLGTHITPESYPLRS